MIHRFHMESAQATLEGVGGGRNLTRYKEEGSTLEGAATIELKLWCNAWMGVACGLGRDSGKVLDELVRLHGQL